MDYYLLKKLASFNEIADCASIKNNYGLLENKYAVRGLSQNQPAIKFYLNKEELLSDKENIKNTFCGKVGVCLFNHAPHARTCTADEIADAVVEIEHEAIEFEKIHSFC